MYRTIVVGHVPTDQGADALALGRELRELTGGDLALARVIHDDAFVDPSVPSSVAPPEELRARQAEEVRSEVEPVARTAVADAHVIGSSSAAHGLHRLAEQLDADLIVVGSSHRGALGRVLPGSVAERLLHGAPCAVAVAPRGFAERSEVSLSVIGVGYDGRPEADLALEEAARLSRGVGGTLRVLAVSPFDPEDGSWNLGLDVIDVAEHEDLERRLHEAVARLPEETRAAAVMLKGRPAEVLADQQVDLLIVGSRGYGPLRTVLLGGVSAPLVRDASAPVLVLPRGAGGTRQSSRPPSGAGAAVE